MLLKRDLHCELVLLTGIAIASFCVTPAWAADPFQRAREQMVQEYIVSAGIKDPRVVDSIRITPRHEFMTARRRNLAYYDMAVPIGHGQTISPPYIVAFMTEQLKPQATDRVLEIGTGSGYQAAVLSPLVKEVYSIEIVEPLGLQAARTLKRLNYRNVFTKVGDGYLGWPEHAPFDKIIVTCSPEDIPQALAEQLTEGGQMIVPVGERFQQTLCRFHKVNGQLQREPLQATFFVPMTGESEELRKVKPDPSNPQIAYGSFETKLGETDHPEGWYYVREAHVAAINDAPNGKHALVFKNDIGGRGAQALQAFGVDGILVRELEVSAWTRGEHVRPGRQKHENARLVVEFYSENRSPIRQITLGPWTGTFEWTKRSRKISVPPTARLAVLGIGLFGATGTLSVDEVVINKPE